MQLAKGHGAEVDIKLKKKNMGNCLKLIFILSTPAEKYGTLTKYFYQIEDA